MVEVFACSFAESTPVSSQWWMIQCTASLPQLWYSVQAGLFLVYGNDLRGWALENAVHRALGMCDPELSRSLLCLFTAGWFCGAAGGGRDKKRLYVWNLIEASLREIKCLPALPLALGSAEVALSVLQNICNTLHDDLGGKCGTRHMKKTSAWAHGNPLVLSPRRQALEACEGVSSQKGHEIICHFAGLVICKNNSLQATNTWKQWMRECLQGFSLKVRIYAIVFVWGTVGEGGFYSGPHRC